MVLGSGQGWGGAVWKKARAGVAWVLNDDEIKGLPEFDPKPASEHVPSAKHSSRAACLRAAKEPTKFFKRKNLRILAAVIATLGLVRGLPSGATAAVASAGKSIFEKGLGSLAPVDVMRGEDVNCRRTAVIFDVPGKLSDTAVKLKTLIGAEPFSEITDFAAYAAEKFKTPIQSIRIIAYDQPPPGCVSNGEHTDGCIISTGLQARYIAGAGAVTYLLTAKVIDMNADPLVEFSTLGAYVMTVPAGAAVLMDNVASGVDLLGYVRHEGKYYAVKLFHTVLGVEAPRTSLVLTWAASTASLIVDAAARLRAGWKPPDDRATKADAIKKADADIAAFKAKEKRSLEAQERATGKTLHERRNEAAREEGHENVGAKRKAAAQEEGYEDQCDMTAKNAGCDNWGDYQKHRAKERGYETLDKAAHAVAAKLPGITSSPDRWVKNSYAKYLGIKGVKDWAALVAAAGVAVALRKFAKSDFPKNKLQLIKARKEGRFSKS